MKIIINSDAPETPEYIAYKARVDAWFDRYRACRHEYRPSDFMPNAVMVCGKCGNSAGVHSATARMRDWPWC